MASTETTETKIMPEINCGNEFVDILDGSFYIMSHAKNALSGVHAARNALLETKKWKFGLIWTNSEYKDKKSKLEEAVAKLKGSLETSLQIFNEENNKKIEKSRLEAYGNWYYNDYIEGDGCEMIIDSPGLNLISTIIAGKHPSIQVNLGNYLESKPSELYNNLSKLKNIELKGLELYVNPLEEASTIPTGTVIGKNIGEILDRKCTTTKVTLTENGTEPSFSSKIYFNDHLGQEVEIVYKTDRTITPIAKEYREWIRESVNTITGHYYYPKPV